jgi:hypothetical protein
MHDARIYTLIDLTNWNDRAGSAITGQCGVQLANHHWGQRHSLVCYVGHVHANWRLTSISCFLLLGSAKLASLHRICCWHTDTAQRIYSSIALPIYWNYLVCTVRTADSINSHDDNAQVRSSWDKLRTAAGSSYVVSSSENSLAGASTGIQIQVRPCSIAHRHLAGTGQNRQIRIL